MSLRQWVETKFGLEHVEIWGNVSIEAGAVCHQCSSRSCHYCVYSINPKNRIKQVLASHRRLSAYADGSIQELKAVYLQHLLQNRYPPLPRGKALDILIAKDIRPEASSDNTPFVIWPAHIEWVKPK